MVRSSMALATVTARPLRLENIRAGRSKPGLKRQHLAAVRAACEICDGELTGDQLESREIGFVPGRVRAGEYQFRISTAGSATLVLQTVIPPLLIADGPSTLVLEGGTHNQWAPPYEFLAMTWAPLINRMGPKVTLTLEQHGFYPAGGGRMRVHITPSPALAGFDLMEAGKIVDRRLHAVVANLPEHVAERELRQATRKLNWSKVSARSDSVASKGPGNVVMAELEYQNLTEVFTAVGRRGVSAEKVADELVRSVRKYEKQKVPVGENLADQILLPLGLSAAQPAACGVQRGGSFRTGPLSLHATTHIELLQRFLDIDVEVIEDDGAVCCRVSPLESDAVR